jgi:hypothetical protein
MCDLSMKPYREPVVCIAWPGVGAPTRSRDAGSTFLSRDNGLILRCDVAQPPDRHRQTGECRVSCPLVCPLGASLEGGHGILVKETLLSEQAGCLFLFGMGRSSTARAVQRLGFDITQGAIMYVLSIVKPHLGPDPVCQETPARFCQELECTKVLAVRLQYVAQEPN